MKNETSGFFVMTLQTSCGGERVKRVCDVVERALTLQTRDVRFDSKFDWHSLETWRHCGVVDFIHSRPHSGIGNYSLPTCFHCHSEQGVGGLTPKNRVT